MQDLYVGDIGDFGKYGMLRELSKSGVSLAINWYKVSPKTQGKQNDGKYIDYLQNPNIYQQYDAELFNGLKSIVFGDSLRNIQQIETSNLLNATFYSDEIFNNRICWHKKALDRTKNAEIVFLDPDNGLETK